jgi:hypothetical protein
VSKFDRVTKINLVIQHLEAAYDFTAVKGKSIPASKQAEFQNNLTQAIEKLESTERILQEMQRIGFRFAKVGKFTPVETTQSLLLGFRNILANGMVGLPYDSMRDNIPPMISALKNLRE